MKRFAFTMAAAVLCLAAALTGYSQDDVEYVADTGFYEKIRPPV